VGNQSPEFQAKKSRVAPRLLQQLVQQCGAIMSMNTVPGNTGRAPTRSANSPRVSQHLIAHQSAAMRAALMVRSQYSRASKYHFSRECLDHLKASLVPVQDVSV
jgi:hypothetical protein